MKIILLIVTIVVLETPAIAQQTSAEDLYAEGQAAYDHADYAGAITKWQASYDLSNETGLIFNIAQARRLSGDCAGAKAAYRRFDTADADSTSDQHKIAKDFVRDLDDKCPEQKPEQKPAELPPKVITLEGHLTDQVDRDQSGRSWKIAGLTTGGIGVTMLAIGIGLGHHGAAIGDEITLACTTSCDWQALQDKDARGRRDVVIGKTLDGLGIAAIAGGAVLYYLGVRQENFTVVSRGHEGAIIAWSTAW